MFRTNYLKDPVYGSFMLGKFMNFFIKKGCKARVQNTFFFIFSNELHDKFTGYFLFFEALEKFRPLFEIVFYKAGREVYKVPKPVTFERKYKLALRYFYRYVEADTYERTFHNRLREQLLEAFSSAAPRVPELDFVKKHAVENRVFSHFR